MFHLFCACHLFKLSNAALRAGRVMLDHEITEGDAVAWRSQGLDAFPAPINRYYGIRCADWELVSLQLLIDEIQDPILTNAGCGTD